MKYVLNYKQYNDLYVLSKGTDFSKDSKRATQVIQFARKFSLKECKKLLYWNKDYFKKNHRKNPLIKIYED